MANLTVREYHPESGELLQNISSLNYGKVTAGTTSRVKVLDIAFSDISEISNIKLGIVSDGNISVNDAPEDIASDGSSSNGHFGIETSSDFDSSIAASPLSRHFPGINSTDTAGDSNNVSVPKRSSVLSNYIYLDIEIASSDISEKNGAYKVYFDYA